MTKPNSPFVKVGNIGSTFGIHGWLKINSYTEFGASILAYQPWYLLDAKGNYLKITPESTRVQGNKLLAKLPNITTPEEAQAYTGRIIAIERSQLPTLEKNEYYWSDLEGMSVIDQHGKHLGNVIYLMATGSNDVLVVKGEKEHAIPYRPGEVITAVDLDKREIHVNWDVL